MIQIGLLVAALGLPISNAQETRGFSSSFLARPSGQSAPQPLSGVEANNRVAIGQMLEKLAADVQQHDWKKVAASFGCGKGQVEKATTAYKRDNPLSSFGSPHSYANEDSVVSGNLLGGLRPGFADSLTTAMTGIQAGLDEIKTLDFSSVSAAKDGSYDAHGQLKFFGADPKKIDLGIMKTQAGFQLRCPLAG